MQSLPKVAQFGGTIRWEADDVKSMRRECIRLKRRMRWEHLEKKASADIHTPNGNFY
jgi:hypothetical protein